MKDRHSYRAGSSSRLATARGSAFASALLVLVAAAEPTLAFEYGVDPMPMLDLDNDLAGGVAQHRLAFFITGGELETYRALIQYPQEFVFQGFNRIGPRNTPIGTYDVDLTDDGLADISIEIKSTGASSAYIDVITDDVFSPNLEPSLDISPTGQLAVTLPMGGDALPGTLQVPRDAAVSITLFAGAIVNPSAPGSYQIAARLVSVDPDTDGPNDGIAPASLEFTASIGVEILPTGPVSFASLDITRALVRSGRPRRDSFFVKGTYALGAGSNGIDPANEDIVVIFGPFSETISGHALRRRDDGYVYTGRSGVRLLELFDDGSFVVSTRSLDLSGLDLAEPVHFELQIGDDAGETGIPFSPAGLFQP